jgi:hypothetical protein
MDAKIITIIAVFVVGAAIVLLARSGNLAFLGAKFDFSKKQSKADVLKSKKVDIDQTGDAKAKISDSEEVRIKQQN